MANLLYPKGKKKILDADIDLLVDTIKLLLIDTADETFNSADEFLSDVAAAGIVSTSAALGSKTTTDGTFDSADSAFTAVSGDPCEAIIMFKDTGVAGTSPLIAWFDITTYTPSGITANVIVHASGWFSI